MRDRVIGEQVSSNFNLSEFTSRGREFAPGNRERYADLARRLQRIRDHVGRPVLIISGERKPDQNEAVRGAANSRHLPPEARAHNARDGVAADFTVPGFSVAQTYGLFQWVDANAAALELGGVEFYPKNNFIHVDTRSARSRWPDLSGRARYERERGAA